LESDWFEATMTMAIAEAATPASKAMKNGFSRRSENFIATVSG
jgi:hypothetical protein